jgi:hypothetical protein
VSVHLRPAWCSEFNHAPRALHPAPISSSSGSGY